MICLAFSVLLTLLAACGSSGNDLYIYCGKREIETDFPFMVEEFKKEYKEKTGEDLNIKLYVGHDARYTLLKTDMGNVDVSQQPTIYYINFSQLTDFIASKQALDLKTDEVRALHPQFYSQLVESIKVGENLTDDGNNSFGIPINYEGFGYYINKTTLGELFNKTDQALDQLVEDIQMSSYEEFITFCLETKKWITKPESAVAVSLSGTVYPFHRQKGPATDKLSGIFSMASANARSEGWTWGFHLYNKSLNLEFSSAYDVSKSTALKWPGAESYFEIIKFQFDHMTDPTPEEKIINKGSYGNELLTEAYSYNASLALFAQGKALMVKQGNWAYTGIAESATKDFLQDMVFIPVKYNLNTAAVTNMNDADWNKLNQIKGATKAEKMDNFNKSITVFVPNYFVINDKANEKKKKLAMEFLLWMQTSQTGLEYITETFAFVPYYEIPDDVNVSVDNPISQSILSYVDRDLTLSNCMRHLEVFTMISRSGCRKPTWHLKILLQQASKTFLTSTKGL